MHKLTTIIIVILINASMAFADNNCPSSALKEKIEVKTIAKETLEGYLSGKGMGLSNAAELNHYPGPRHVLETADKLFLSKEQSEKTEELYKKMLNDAVQLGRMIVEKEKLLDELFVNQPLDETEVRLIVMEIAALNGELRLVHLNAHMKMKEILSQKQIDEYDRLRGYSETRTGHSHTMMHR